MADQSVLLNKKDLELKEKINELAKLQEKEEKQEEELKNKEDVILQLQDIDQKNKGVIEKLLREIEELKSGANNVVGP